MSPRIDSNPRVVEGRESFVSGEAAVTDQCYDHVLEDSRLKPVHLRSVARDLDRRPGAFEESHEL
jgi:hypothetical protein